MILFNHSRIYSFTGLVNALQDAAKAVVFLGRIESDNVSRAYGTGTMITDDLLLTPDFIVPKEVISNSKLTCRFADTGFNGAVMELDQVPGPESLKEAEHGFILFRLSKPQPGRAIRFHFDTVEMESDVFIIQHNSGNAEQGISVGRIKNRDKVLLDYDADTEPGSSGSPVILGNGCMAGMHYKANRQATSVINQGVALDEIFRQLRQMPEWSEIAAFHQLADIQSQGAEPVEKGITSANNDEQLLLNAALRWYIDPAELSDHEKELLQPVVVEGLDDQWTMLPEERMRLINKAADVPALREARGEIKSDDPGEKVIDRVLKGGPYNLHELSETELQYWLQAVTWFATKIKDLPGAADINLELEQRRIKGRLKLLTIDFRGRKTELQDLAKWYIDKNSNSTLVTGVGGVGKSSLISKFILEVPGDPPFFWLDFDRADLSPDDAESVLTAIAEQAFFQLKGFKKMNWGRTGIDWKAEATALGKAIKELVPQGVAPLVVLDGFEVAQQIKKYNEIWDVLECLIAGLPSLKVIVSGRAEVRELKLNEKKATPFPLKGIDDESAAGWLGKHGVTDKDTISAVLKISHNIPMVLILAAKLADQGKISDLPETLPAQMVEGYLYRRILNRVVDPKLQPLARDVLAVRMINMPMLVEIFTASLPAGLTIAEVFDRLKREMNVVNEVERPNQDFLVVRPEVRSSTLRLLDKEDPARIKLINEKALKWYSSQKEQTDRFIAEQVYHYLRLNDIAAAEKIWKDECRVLLMDAEGDFDPPSSVGKWIVAKLRQVSSEEKAGIWEKDALSRIKDALRRGRVDIIPRILEEHSNRASDSSLIVYDAFAKMMSGDLKSAKAVLDTAAENKYHQTDECLLLAALIARNDNRRNDAAAFLSRLEKRQIPPNYTAWLPDQLMLRCAQVRINVLLEKEMRFFKTLNEKYADNFYNGELKLPLLSADTIFEPLRLFLEEIASRKAESYRGGLRVPDSMKELQYVAGEVVKKRFQVYELNMLEKDLANLFTLDGIKKDPLFERIEDILVNVNDKLPFLNEEKAALHELQICGFHKWALVSEDFFLWKLITALDTGALDHMKFAAAAGTLAAYRGERLNFPREVNFGENNVDEFIMHVVRNNKYMMAGLPVRQKSLSLLEDLNKSGNSIQKYPVEKTATNYNSSSPYPGAAIMDYESLMQVKDPKDLSILLFAAGPDPLELLCTQALGLPPDYQF